tara:strand:+ start:2868 stop:3863 length:996 start_codon:yes stop_codon:yes gene_type:complete
MIIKHYDLKKKITLKDKFFLLYGDNIGLIEDTIKFSLKPILPKKVFRYEEREIIENFETFKENILNKSFFENEKVFIISRVSDKIFTHIEQIVTDEIDDIYFILTASRLEKKSKIRSFFEKNSKTTCVAFYEDNNQTLALIVKNFLSKNKISISQQNINLIVERVNGDRISLKNELIKIENFIKNKKNISSEQLLQLTNLAENYSLSELIDNCLAKNYRKTINILNENNFDESDCIIILRILSNKLKRLLQLQNKVKEKTSIENAIMSFKPPIFWKEKEIVKAQLQNLDRKQIHDLIIKTNEIEYLVKKMPQAAINITHDFILDNCNKANN